MSYICSLNQVFQQAEKLCQIINNIRLSLSGKKTAIKINIGNISQFASPKKQSDLLLLLPDRYDLVLGKTLPSLV